MADAGFFRGTSADQDNRFANKQKKLLKELNFSPILNSSVDMSKIDLPNIKPWIETKITEILEKEDEILSESIYEHLAMKEPNGKDILVLITGFVDDENKASEFMEALWTKLIDIQDNSNGVPSKQQSKPQSSPSSKNDPRSDDIEDDNRFLETVVKDKPKQERNVDMEENSLNEGTVDKVDSDDASKREKEEEDINNHVGKVQAKGKPQDGEEEVVNKSPGSKSRSASRSDSRSKSKSHSKSRSKSRSRSRSRNSRSMSKTRTRTRTRTRSRTRSRSRSPVQFRRGAGNPRMPYHGSSYGYHDRPRRAMGGGPYGRRRSPWGRRRYSPPRSPMTSGGPRRRRTPSISPPRRRRTPSPYNRRSRSPMHPGLRRGRRTPSISPLRRRRTPSPYSRRSRSPVNIGVRRRRTPSMSPPRRHRTPPSPHSRRLRSPPTHMINRNSPPRPYAPVGDMIPAGMRHVGPRHPHDMHRPMVSDMLRSPRGPVLSGSSRLDTRHQPHVGLPGPSKSGPYSPRSTASGSSSGSSRRKHKKDKKSRHKHKKSKKHRSASPDKRKKHKKHKKTKKSHRH